MTTYKPRFVSLAIGTLLLLGRAEARGDERAGLCADKAERAQDLRDGSRLVEAAALLLECAQEQCPVAVRDSCTGWLADVERRTPSIVISLKDPDGNDIPHARVTLDGSPLAESVLTTALRVNPGIHVISCDVDGFASVKQSIVLREGEGLRVVRLAVTGPVSTRPKSTAARGTPAFVYALGGAGVLALGISAIFGISGVLEFNRLEGQCKTSCTHAETADVRGRFLVADVSLVVGLVSLTGAGALYLFGGAPSRDPRVR